MIIQIDTREKEQAIEKIRLEFEKRRIQTIRSKMYVGDYMALENPFLVIDRKQTIQELAENATTSHDRFKRELHRMDEIGAEMVVLIEQKRYTDIQGELMTVNDISDLMFWRNPYGEVDGIRVYKILATWQARHRVRFEFCRRDQTGRRIVEILEEGIEQRGIYKTP